VVEPNSLEIEFVKSPLNQSYSKKKIVIKPLSIKRQLKVVVPTENNSPRSDDEDPNVDQDKDLVTLTPKNHIHKPPQPIHKTEVVQTLKSHIDDTMNISDNLNSIPV